MSRLAVVYLGPPAAALPVSGDIAEEVSLDRLASADELVAVLERWPVVWLPAWVRLEAKHWASIVRWLDEGHAATARARVRMAGPGFAVPLGRALVLARPGASALHAGRPVRKGGATHLLDEVWDVVPPGELSEHLRAANRQSSDAIRLSSEAARTPGLLDLLRPLGLLPRCALRGHGPFRRTLPRAVIEGYRGALLSAKAWERRNVAPQVATP